MHGGMIAERRCSADRKRRGGGFADDVLDVGQRRQRPVRSPRVRKLQSAEEVGDQLRGIFETHPQEGPRRVTVSICGEYAVQGGGNS